MIVLKKFLIVILTLFLSVSFLSCSLDDEEKQNSGVVFYTAKADTNTEPYTSSTKNNNLLKNEPENTEAVETDVVKINDASIVYVTPSGKKYHLSKTCPGKNAKPITLEEAISSGRDACKKCTD